MTLIGRRRRSMLELRKRDLQDSSSSQDHRPLKQVLQLANVTRPAVIHQGLHRLDRNPLNVLFHLLSKLVHKERHQQSNVIATLAKWRHRDGKEVEPVAEIVAKLFID